MKFATDITAQVMADKLCMRSAQTQASIGAAKDNDLTQRVPLEGMTGEMRRCAAA